MNAPEDASMRPPPTPSPPDTPETPRRHRRNAPLNKHGLNVLKRAVRTLGPRTLDRRTALGKQLAAWRTDLIRDLGGDPSTAQLAVVDLAVRTRLMLDSIDAWLLVQPSLVNLRKRALLPVVRERQQLGDALARYLGQIGLERREQPVADLATYLATKTPPSPSP